MVISNKELIRFIISGICAVLTDMLFYYIFSFFLNLSIAKGLSFLLGTITAYLMNKYYTFTQKKKDIKEIIKFISLYISTLLVNISINKLSLMFLPAILGCVSFLDCRIIKLLAFLCATGVSTILNFFGQKYWVFKR